MTSDERVAELEKEVAELNKQLNGSSDLIKELNKTSSIFADDLRAIREGKEEETVYIGKAAKSKKFEHVMVLIKEIAALKALAQIPTGKLKKSDNDDIPKNNIADYL